MSDPDPAAPRRCDHKFIDSRHCLKCGWNPDAGLLLQCHRCGRLDYKREGEIDKMHQPDGGICGGIFKKDSK